MKTPRGTEVNVGPGHIVLDGTQLPCERGTAAPLLYELSSAQIFIDYLLRQTKY